LPAFLWNSKLKFFRAKNYSKIAITFDFKGIAVAERNAAADGSRKQSTGEADVAEPQVTQQSGCKCPRPRRDDQLDLPID